MNTLIEFFSFQDPNVVWVVAGVVFVCTGAALTGCFTFLRKRALVGDAISHAILPGICIAFLIAQTKHPLVLLTGAFAAGWAGVLSVNAITTKTRLKSDAALALVLSVFYGFGIFLLTTIQNSGNAAQSGLDKFLFGKAAALGQVDVLTFSTFSLVIMLLIFLFFRHFRLISFDRDFAQTIGVPVRRLELLLSAMTVLTIALGIQAVGVVLMAALLIAPAAAARYWTEKLGVMLILSALFAAIAGVAGAFVSYTTPRMPTGPWIVSILSLFAVFSVLAGRKRGVIAMALLRYRNRRKILHENMLKCLYHLGEADEKPFGLRSASEMQSQRHFKAGKLQNGLRRLRREGLIRKENEKVALTEDGLKAGRRVVRIHRLWELYLTTYLQLPADHVHEDAEAIEHIITPELERELEARLRRPGLDPHKSNIPYEETD